MMSVTYLDGIFRNGQFLDCSMYLALINNSHLERNKILKKLKMPLEKDFYEVFV